MKSWARLLPLLAFYLLFVLIFSSNTLRYDEISYATLAVSLAQGHYTPPAGEPFLWRGPGYPLVLLPFVVLHLPYSIPKLLNAFFLFGAVCFFYGTLRAYIPERKARYAALALGLYPSLLAESNLLFTEPFATFLISGFCFSLCLALRKEQRYWTALISASVFLAYLALSKVLFGYVALAGLLLALALYLGQRRPAFGKTAITCALALILCLPWLIYTFKQTGKVFYWGTSGGMQLYWMSTPYAGEYGDWVAPATVFAHGTLNEHHGELFERISQLNAVQSDEELKSQAIRNISQHPAKYALNWIANVSRLWFSFPYTVTYQDLRPVPRMVSNLIVLLLALAAFYPGWLNRKQVPIEIYVVLAFGLIAFGGSSLLSAYERQFHILVPALGLWIAYALAQFFQVSVIRGRQP